MSPIDTALIALKEANPTPTETVEHRPSASEMIALAEQSRVEDATELAPTRRRTQVMVVAAAFVAALAVGVSAFLLSTRDVPSDPIDFEPPPTTEAAPLPTTTLPSIAVEPEVPASVAAVLQDLEALYSTGDVDGVMGLLEAGTVKTTKRDSEPPSLWTEDDFRYQLVIDAILNTKLTFNDCEFLSTGSVLCKATRSNDLTRIAGVGPQDDEVLLRVESGQITVWQDRQGVHATPYQQAAVAPFTAWLAEAHPEIEDPHPLIGGVSRWWLDRDISPRLAVLVSEYAASVGFDLDA